MIHARLTRIVLMCLSGAVLGTGVAFAQAGRARPVESARVDLGLTVATHGAPAEINLTLRLGEGVRVGKVEAEVRFAKNRMSFVAPRPAPEGVRLEVTRQPDRDGQAVLKILAESSDPNAPLAAGVLTKLVFEVAKDKKDKKSTLPIEVPLEARVWGYPDLTREITPVEMFAGRVTLQDAETFFGCFFYMH